MLWIYMDQHLYVYRLDQKTQFKKMLQHYYKENKAEALTVIWKDYKNIRFFVGTKYIIVTTVLMRFMIDEFK